MINHASNVLICKKRNDAISGVVQSWAVKASVTKSETLKGNEILYFLTVMLVKPSLTLEEKWLIKKSDVLYFFHRYLPNRFSNL